jgi:D-glycero-alpha-D-manno-heptose-7-phosphate kinase
MIVSRTPVRVSFLGGGTDYPEQFQKYGGQVLGVAINKYSYITVNQLAPLFDYSIRVSYSRTELVSAVEEIRHPAVRECLRLLKIDGGVEIHYVGDLPARTGLGSSSSFTVALLHALHAFKGELASHAQLAEEAVHVEREMIGERVGVQDQYTCAHGGLVHLQIDRDGRISVGRVPMFHERFADLRAHLMLFYTGIRRDAHEVLDEQLDRTRRGALVRELSRLGDLAAEGVEVLAGRGPLARFGELLDAAWQIKRQLSSKVTSIAIDSFYTRARAAGAIGGKLLGAGGGGFLLLFAAPERQDAILATLPELPRVHFGFDYEGSRLLFYQPD